MLLLRVERKRQRYRKRALVSDPLTRLHPLPARYARSRGIFGPVLTRKGKEVLGKIAPFGKIHPPSPAYRYSFCDSQRTSHPSVSFFFCLFSHLVAEPFKSIAAVFNTSPQCLLYCWADLALTRFFTKYFFFFCQSED